MGDDNHLTLDKVEYILTYQNVDNLEALIQELANRFLGGDVPLKAKDRIKQSVLNGVSESYWKEAINEYRSNPTENMKNNLNGRVQQLLSKLFQLGEINLF
jgi:phosphoglucomutase